MGCGQCQVASPDPGIGGVEDHPDQAPARLQLAAASLQAVTDALTLAAGPGLKSCSSRGTAISTETVMGTRARA